MGLPKEVAGGSCWRGLLDRVAGGGCWRGLLKEGCWRVAGGGCESGLSEGVTEGDDQRR